MKSRWDNYTCRICNKITIARVDDPGAIPYLIKCHATEGCEGMATSCVHMCDQSRRQVPHVIFFRPPDDEIRRIVKERYPDEKQHDMMLKSHMRGELVMRKGP